MRIVRTLLVALLALATPLFASSPEYLVGGTQPTIAPYLRGEPSAATDGTDFFVVWSDSRSYSGSVIGTRMKRDGQILDPLGIRIASTPGQVMSPQVVWDGSAYLVIWTAPEPVANSYPQESVYAARINREGGLVMGPRVIASNASTPRGHYAASNGKVSVIVYESQVSGPDFPARIVALDPDGNTLHDELLVDQPTYRRGFSIAAGATRFVAAWDDNTGYQLDESEVKAVSLTSTGHVIDAPVKVGNGDLPVVASDGTNFLIAGLRYTSSNMFPVTVLESHTASADLKSIGPAKALTSGYMVESTTLLWRGDRYEAVAGRRPKPNEAYEIATIQVDRNGNKIAETSRGAVDVILFGELAAATNGSDLLVSVVSTFNLPYQVSARLYRGSSPVPETSMLLSWSGNAHSRPSIASSPAGHFAAWSEDEGVYATRMDRQGHALDGRGIRLATRSGETATAFDGTNYVVAWGNGNGAINVLYIAPATGATIAEVQVPATFWAGITLAESPDATFLAYNDDERIRVTRIHHATHTPDPAPLAVSPEGMLVAHPAAAWNGSTLLVAWNEMEYVPRADPPFAYGTRVYAARITAGLSLLDPAPLPVFASAEHNYFSHSLPSVASNGEDWLVVADVDRGDGKIENDILARRISANGTFPGFLPATLAGGHDPVVAWDGIRYIAAWKEGERYEGYEHPATVAIVSATGTPMVTRLLPVTANATQSPLSIAPAGNGEVAIAYTRISFLPEHTGVDRSFFRVMDFAPRGRLVRR